MFIAPALFWIAHKHSLCELNEIEMLLLLLLFVDLLRCINQMQLSVSVNYWLLFNGDAMFWRDFIMLFYYGHLS